MMAEHSRAWRRTGPIHNPRRGSRAKVIYALVLGSVLAFAALLKLILLLRAVGFEQGDPLEYINIAYTIAHATHEEWWDIRPLVYPLTLVPFIWLGERLPDVTGEAAVRLLRCVPLVFSLGSLWICAAIAHTLSNRIGAIVAALILAANPTFNQLSVSPFAEVPATFGVLCAVLVAIRTRPSFWSGGLAGTALGLACMARYQSLAFIGPFGLWMLLGRRLPRLTGFIAGLLACVAFQAALDDLAYGAPFHSLIQSAAYNVTTDEAASFYGAQPFIWYLQSVGEWLGYPTLALAVVGGVLAVAGHLRWQWLLVLGLTVTMLLWLSAIGHKELRFTSQLTPFLAIAAGHGASSVARIGPRLGRIAVVPLVGLAAIPGIVHSLSLNLTFNPGFVEGPKMVAAEHSGAVLGTIPWFIARPYVHNRIELVRADVDRWHDREYMTQVLERSDYLLLREYDFATDRTIQRLVDRQYRTVETYPEQVVLLEKRSGSTPRGR
jgi:hypothetical protein